jgi:hypothetical protein
MNNKSVRKVHNERNMRCFRHSLRAWNAGLSYISMTTADQRNQISPPARVRSGRVADKCRPGLLTEASTKRVNINSEQERGPPNSLYI